MDNEEFYNQSHLVIKQLLRAMVSIKPKNKTRKWSQPCNEFSTFWCCLLLVNKYAILTKRAFCLTIAWVSYFLEREFWHKTNVKEENLYMSYWCWLCMFILFCYMFFKQGKSFSVTFMDEISPNTIWCL